MKNSYSKTLNYVVYLVLVIGFLALLSGTLRELPAEKYSERDFLTYHNELLTPEEISNGAKPKPFDEKNGFSRYRTSVMELDLTPGEVYGIYAENFTYATKVFVDGKVLYEGGRVADNKEEYIPKTGTFTVYFTADEHTQIVIQRCNFDHARWSDFSFSMDKQEVITRNAQLRMFKSLAVIVFLFTLGLINLGMFAGMHERRQYLWYAMSCFSILLNIALTNPKLMMTVLPNLNWFIGHRIESCSLVLTGAFLILFVHDCIEKPKWKLLNIADYVLICGSLLYFVLLPVSIYSRYVLYLGIAAAVYGVIYFIYYLLWLIKNRASVKPVKRLYLIGILIIVFAVTMGAVHLSTPFLLATNIGLTVFEVIMTLAMAMEFRDIQKAYETSKGNEEQLRRMNESMEQGLELQKNFISIMNHEIRTPLTVIAGYSELSAKELESRGENDEELIRSLQYIKQEALRLGRIVEQSDIAARSELALTTMEEIELEQLFKEAQTFCEPICEKRSNRIVTECAKGLTLKGYHDSLIQLLYNLIINASRHTEAGIIRLCAEKDESAVTVSVSDNGDGIDEATALHAFEKGFSGDGGSGLGLAICKEIAEGHQAEIFIGNNESGGTTVRTVFPV